MKTRYQIACAILSGLLVSLSFPTVLFKAYLPDMGWLAWVAIVPLILAIREAGPKKAFVVAFATGLVAYSVSLYWIYSALHHYGKLPPLASTLVLALMIVILAAYLAVIPWLARLIQTRWRGELIAILPACWVAVEFLRNCAPVGGFPWANIAMSQWRALWVIQIADIVGVYGIMFLIVWVNVCLSEIVAAIAGMRPNQLKLKIVVTGVLLAVVLIYGRVRMDALRGEFATSGATTIGIVQGNIAQEDKWRDDKAADNLNVLRRGTRALRDASVDLVIWPEASFPWPIDTRATSVDPMALGFDADELSPLPYLVMGAISENPDGSYHNSVVLFDAKGAIKGRYHKMHLVPFGEYVPFKKLLFFAQKLTEPAGNFSPGESYQPLTIGDAKAGPLVCYEDIFPQISRRFVANGAEYLLNVTNDAWYGVTSAPYQHVALAVFRAVENRRFMVRATNTGVSAVITPTGKMEVQSGIFHDALIVAPVGLKKEISLYTKLGDWFAYACAAYTMLGLIMAAVMEIKRRKALKTEN